MNIDQLLKENELLKNELQKREVENDRLIELVGSLQDQVRLLQHLHFGAKSEKLTKENKKHSCLFNEAEDAAFDQSDGEQEQTVTDERQVGPYTRRAHSKNAGRKPISEDLPREIEEYDIPEEDKICSCGTEKTCIGYDSSEWAKIIPAQVVVVQERRKKYAYKSCEGIKADETHVQALKEPGRKAESKSWMWAFVGGKAGKESVVFQYDPSRSNTVPYEFFSEYNDWLQTDDYEAYHTALKKIAEDRNGQDPIRHVLCWAHVRRRFYHYWKLSKSPDAKKILDLIKDLFELEDLRSEFSVKGFSKQRKNRAGPILEQLYKTLTRLLPEVPPGLDFRKAIAYTLDNWEQLILYLDYPLLTPSNNKAENAIRPFVIGRKNWMFAGTPKSARSSAIL